MVKGWDNDLQVPRALKILLPDLARKRSLRERFQAEAQIMARLEHRHIVRVFDVGLHGKVPYIAMELLPGGSLQTWLEAHGPMPAPQVVEVVLDLCSAVAHAHAHGVVHRDIKPHNVLVASDGTVKLTDFGIARTDHGKTKPGVAMGTLGYVAPEQLANARSATLAADVHSLAVTLWKLITDGPVERLAYDLDHGALDTVPHALQGALRLALSQRLERRTPDVEAFRASLLGAADMLPAAPSVALVQGGLPSDADESWDTLSSTLHELLDDSPPSLAPSQPVAPLPLPMAPRRPPKRSLMTWLGGTARAVGVGVVLCTVPLALVGGLRVADGAFDLRGHRAKLVESAGVLVESARLEGPAAVRAREASWGADRTELQARYHALEVARVDDDRVEAAERFVEAVEVDVASTLPEDPARWSPEQRSDVERLLRMRQAMESYRAARERVEGDGGGEVLVVEPFP